MIRLTPDDVLTVVSLYQQQLHALQSRGYEEIRQQLARQDCIYLPEDT